MIYSRIIPCLLIQDGKLVKTVRFNNPEYVGDPLNAIRIFNEMGADEIIVLDISATPEKREPAFDLIEAMASECFMPFSYGGGIRSLDQARRLFKIGIEKIIVNSAAFERPEFIREVSREFGSQSVIAAVDVKKAFWGGYEIVTRCGKKKTGKSPQEYIQKLEELGAGEIFLNSIDRDGTWKGYDCDLIAKTAVSLKIPLIACGGAGKNEDFRCVLKAGASAAAAGSMFIYQKKGFGVLINYPSQALRKEESLI